MINPKKFLVVLLGIFVLIFTSYFRGLKNGQRDNGSSTGIENKVTVTKTPVLVKSSKGIFKEQTKEVIIPYVPPEGSVTIEPRRQEDTLNDIIKVSARRYGLTFEPGIQTSLLLAPNIGLDAKLFYIGRWGSTVGFLCGSNLDILCSPNFAISYRLDRIRFIRNTEIWCGYVPLVRVPYQVGFRINL